MTGTMRGVQILAVVLRLLACLVLAGSVAACSTSVSGEPAADTSAASPSARADSGDSGGDRSRSNSTCQVTISSNGSISSSGASSSTQTVNGRTSFACAKGPKIGIDKIDAGGVTFTADGAPTTVAPGTTATVGAYRITVDAVDGDTARFAAERV